MTPDTFVFSTFVFSHPAELRLRVLLTEQAIRYWLESAIGSLALEVCGRYGEEPAERWAEPLASAPTFRFSVIEGQLAAAMTG